MAALRTPALRLAAQQTRTPLLLRRTAATETAKAKASDAKDYAQSKASDLKEKLPDTDGAKERLASAQQAASSRLSGLVDLTSRGISATTHSVRVVGQVYKQVYILERLAPPSLGDFKPSYDLILSRFQDNGWWKEQYRQGRALVLAIMFLEVYLIFKLGEVIGRGNIRGYDIAPGIYAEDKEE